MSESWVSTQENLPNRDDIYRIRLSDNSEKKAYFYKDKIGWIGFYGHKSSHWWDEKTGEGLDRVTHWLSKEKK